MKRLGLIVVVLAGIGAGVWAMRGPSPLRAGEEVVFIVPLKDDQPRGYLPTKKGNVYPGTKLRLTEDVRPDVPIVRALVLEGDAEGEEAYPGVSQIRRP